jgi:Domain of unknown function (DUF4362)
MPFHVARFDRSGYCEGNMEIRFSFCRFVAMAIVLTTVLSSCTKSKTKSPDGEESVSSTSSAVPLLEPFSADAGANASSCGREEQMHGQGYDEAARTCLWDAYRSNRPAELVMIRHTIEGDPISITLRVRSKTSIEVIEDNRDRFGARGLRSSVCKELERSAAVNGRAGFVIRTCEGSDEKIDVP